jgi:hypothetical protein
MNKKPVVLAMNVGYMGEPTTFLSVRPSPANWVCFCFTRRARCAPIRAKSRSGMMRMCRR